MQIGHLGNCTGYFKIVWSYKLKVYFCFAGNIGDDGDRGEPGLPSTESEKGHYLVPFPDSIIPYKGLPGDRGPRGDNGTPGYKGEIGTKGLKVIKPL